MQTLEIASTVPYSQAFLYGIYDELPDRELEAKLRMVNKVDPASTIAMLATHIATSEGVTVIEGAFETSVDIVEKYAGLESFSIVHRSDGIRFVKHKTDKVKRSDGVIVSKEYKTLWNEGDPFPEEAAGYMENCMRIGTVTRRKDGIFAVNDNNGRVYQAILDTVRREGDRQVSNDNQTLQQIEVEYKGTTCTPSGASERELVTAISGDIVNIRGLVLEQLLDSGIAAKLTKQTKTDWLLKSWC